jgi:hypothetical protein
MLIFRSDKLESVEFDSYEGITRQRLNRIAFDSTVIADSQNALSHKWPFTSGYSSID